MLAAGSSVETTSGAALAVKRRRQYSDEIEYPRLDWQTACQKWSFSSNLFVAPLLRTSRHAESGPYNRRFTVFGDRITSVLMNCVSLQVWTNCLIVGSNRCVNSCKSLSKHKFSLDFFSSTIHTRAYCSRLQA
jgi:hypothetical protein